MTDSVHLTRRKPDANMSRFYAVTLMPNLFGSFDIIREWGRIGSAGQQRIECFATAAAASQALNAFAQKKRKKGYV